MAQPELFTAADLVQPPKSPPPRPEPDPRWLRRHLNEMLGELRFCIALPWRDAEFDTQDGRFRGIAAMLGPDEAPTWIDRWDAEIARLRAGGAPGG